jgi:hypothetical protein
VFGTAALPEQPPPHLRPEDGPNEAGGATALEVEGGIEQQHPRAGISSKAPHLEVTLRHLHPAGLPGSRPAPRTGSSAGPGSTRRDPQPRSSSRRKSSASSLRPAAVTVSPASKARPSVPGPRALAHRRGRLFAFSPGRTLVDRRPCAKAGINLCRNSSCPRACPKAIFADFEVPENAETRLISGFPSYNGGRIRSYG